ncbi:hypothetical protein MRX96_029255 [Rhipicephalus microplus]
MASRVTVHAPSGGPGQRPRAASVRSASGLPSRVNSVQAVRRIRERQKTGTRWLTNGPVHTQRHAQSEPWRSTVAIARGVVRLGVDKETRGVLLSEPSQSLERALRSTVDGESAAALGRFIVRSAGGEPRLPDAFIH